MKQVPSQTLIYLMRLSRVHVSCLNWTRCVSQKTVDGSCFYGHSQHSHITQMMANFIYQCSQTHIFLVFIWIRRSHQQQSFSRKMSAGWLTNVLIHQTKVMLRSKTPAQQHIFTRKTDSCMGHQRTQNAALAIQ